MEDRSHQRKYSTLRRPLRPEHRACIQRIRAFHHIFEDRHKDIHNYARVFTNALSSMDFNGNFNHAIMIRTFLSKNHQLHYQAGAGIVAKSTAENELQEVNNKLGALKKAVLFANEINKK